MRWAFHILALLSALVCIASVVFWIRSATVTDRVLHQADDGSVVVIATYDGRLVVFLFEDGAAQPGDGWSQRTEEVQLPLEELIGYYENDAETHVTFLGGLYWRGRLTGPPFNAYTIAAVPLWLVTVLSAATPACRLLLSPRRRRRRRAEHGLCANCGYDLRGGTDGKPCPECGATSR